MPARSLVLGAVAAVLFFCTAIEPAAGQAGTLPVGCCIPPWSGLPEDLERQVAALRAPSEYAELDVRKGLERFFLAELQRRQLSDWARLPDPGLVALFEAAYIVVFYTGSPASIDRLLDIHRSLEARGVASAEQAVKVMRSLVVGRRFDQARALAKRLRLEGNVPRVLSGEQLREAPGVFRIADARTLVRESMELSGVRLVIVGSPACGFFQRAIADLSNEPRLAAWIRYHAVLLLPHLEPPDLDRLARWNERHPDFALRIPHAADEWPWIRRWSTPGFYLVADGALRDHFIGWPGAGSLARLRSMIEAGEDLRGRSGER